MRINGEAKGLVLEYYATDPTDNLVEGRVVIVATTPKVYKSGAWQSLSGATTSNAPVEWKEKGPAPLIDSVGGLEVMEFEHTGGQYIYATIQVPTDYVAGNIIALQYGKFASKAVGDVKMKATTYLIQAGTTDITSLTNSHNSVNAAITVATENQATSIGDIDLTNTSGEINSVAVAGGDLLLVKLFRDVAHEQTKTNNGVQVFKYSFVPNFNA